VVARVNQDQGRELLVDAAESLLSIINTNEKLRPYLPQYPFPPEKISLLLSMTNKKNDPYQDGSLDCIHIDEGKVVYYRLPIEGKESREDCPKGCFTEEEEYSQAVERLKSWREAQLSNAPPLSFWNRLAAKFKAFYGRDDGLLQGKIPKGLPSMDNK
jgi:hypothetical protein